MAGDLIELLLPGGDLLHERRGGAALSSGGSEIADLVLQLLNTLAHPTNFVVQSCEGQLKLPLELCDGVFDGFGPQYSILQLSKKTGFYFICTLPQSVCTRSTIDVVRTSIAGMAVFATSTHDSQIVAAHATFQKACQEIRACCGTVHKTRTISEVVAFMNESQTLLHSVPKRIVNNAEFGLLNDDPLGFRSWPSKPLVRTRLLHEL